MKTFLYLFSGFALLILTATCNQAVSNDQTEITGTIQEQGITSYQYGTHTLTNSNIFYAITSEAVDLDKYLNQEVTVIAEEIEGYPIDAGPVYLRILKIK